MINLHFPKVTIPKNAPRIAFVAFILSVVAEMITKADLVMLIAGVAAFGTLYLKIGRLEGVTEGITARCQERAGMYRERDNDATEDKLVDKIAERVVAKIGKENVD